MTKKVVTIDINGNASDAAKEMIKHDVGSVIVVRKGEPVGIVTERDLVREIIATNIKPSEMKIAKLMKSPLITISPNSSLIEVARKMVKMNIRRLPVVEKGELLGIVTDTDVIAASSELNETLLELMEINREPLSESKSPKSFVQGICERCAAISESLESIDGILVCESCKDDLKNE
jgi:signal-transduction protein with cAMP-binding, CBS, and nucleotidyltransferase domain